MLIYLKQLGEGCGVLGGDFSSRGEARGERRWLAAELQLRPLDLTLERGSNKSQDRQKEAIIHDRGLSLKTCKG